MSYADAIRPEFDHEMASTRKVIERIPDDKWNWKAHPKSNTIGWNANHLAEMVGWAEGVLKESSFDIHPPGAERYKTPSLPSKKEVLESFDRNVAASRKALDAVTDADIMKNWSLLDGGKAVITMPRAAVMRSFILNHIIHHRAVLCVYLRLNDVPVPDMYGPSGDN